MIESLGRPAVVSQEQPKTVVRIGKVGFEFKGAGKLAPSFPFVPLLNENSSKISMGLRTGGIQLDSPVQLAEGAIRITPRRQGQPEIHVGGSRARIYFECGSKLVRSLSGMASRQARGPARQTLFERLLFLALRARFPRGFELPAAVVGVPGPNQRLAECIARVPVCRITGQGFPALLDGGCPILPRGQSAGELSSGFEQRRVEHDSGLELPR